MRDISFLEWFLLGMPWELVVGFAVVGGLALLVGAAVDALRGRGGGRDGRDPRGGDPPDPR